MQVHFHSTVQENIFSATLDEGVTLYRINFGIKLKHTDTKLKLSAPVTVQLAKTHRSMFKKDCFMILPGSCTDNEEVCDHLQNMYWNEHKTAWACGEDMIDHVDQARVELNHRVNKFLNQVKERFQKHLNKLLEQRALSPEEDDQLFEQIHLASNPVNEIDQAESIEIVDQERLDAIEMTKQNADRKQNELGFVHEDEKTHGRKFEQGWIHMDRMQREGSDFGLTVGSANSLRYAGSINETEPVPETNSKALYKAFGTMKQRLESFRNRNRKTN
jgi:hypothetical protein